MTERGEPIVRMPLRVRYHECDGQGIVFNANYLAYVDMAAFECSKALFGSHAKLLERGYDQVVAESNIRYLAPCHFEDELVVEAYVERVGRTSLLFEFRINRGEETVTVVKTRYVWVSMETMRPAEPPEDIQQIFTAYAPQA
ncbi:acyl-CoA thioesterase [Amycolatopsis anabasis]|uniref:acyl-CoA thioesterase n=1 Tax=Amycolatopsis anabasis TaxID=1840409 RepID=UPI00131AD663|nr:thioesterase family protein [Amycolatopsis anabasis]